MGLSNLQELPPEVKEVIFSSDFVEHNGEIVDKFFLNKNQLDFILNLENDIFLQNKFPLDLPNELEEMERAEYYDLRAIALEIAYKILWPLQDYLKTVDRLILRLGGKVPKIQHLHKLAIQRKLMPPNITANIKRLIADYDDFQTLRLTSKKIADESGRLVSPTVGNWIRDYVHFAGAGYHNSLKRAEYLAKGENVRVLSDNEKESLRHFIVSYDDNVDVDVENVSGLLRISEASKKNESSEDFKIQLNKVLERLEKEYVDIEKEILHSSFIMSEANNDIHKLRDILWQAIGVQDKYKVVSCLKVLLEKQAFDLMIKEDNRFRSILKRFISIRYGHNVESWLDNNLDKLLTKRLFLEMILVDKLNFSDEKAALIAFYLSNLISGTEQIIYLDEGDGELKWRELQVNRNSLVWVK